MIEAAPAYFPTFHDAQIWLADRAGGDPFDYARDNPRTMQIAESHGVGPQVLKAIEQSRDLEPQINAAIKRAETRRESDPLGAEKPSLILRRGADIKPAPIAWLWQHWLAAGKLHILAGAPGTGKTTIALTLGAILSAGGVWPSGERAPVKRVLVWSGEDGPDDTIAPRLIAAGANMERVEIVEGIRDGDGRRPFDPAQDVPHLLDALSKLDDVGLLVVDPIVSAVASDSNKNAEVRRALQPLVDLANAKGCAVLGISHFSKGTAGRDPVERVTGSVAFGALPRIVLAAAKVTEQDAGREWRLLARSKSNIGPDDGGFRYDVAQATIPEGVEANRIVWGEAVQGTARELLAMADQTETPEDRDERLNVSDFLAAELRDGPRSAGEIIRSGEAQGFSKRTIQRTASKMGVTREHGSELAGGWLWNLPTNAEGAKKPEGAHSERLASSAPSEGSVSPSDGAEVF